ncbi:glycosyltransferase [Alterinioella nitratireducens]|uniref:glycosyltransferase n=1 Tax=Alterinioella nitratireducens TaxID=2735915 RepID=UPI00155301D2|nr:glycosyltransferase [Alterinioella nitratireducens]NPD21306.1 glycosyltransferase [Alterinioella nitratireducens]
MLNRIRGLYVRYAAHHKHEAEAGRAFGPLLISLRFVIDGTRALPAVVGWLITRDPVWRARVKARMHLNVTLVALPMQDGLFAGAAPQPLDSPVTIVLPVYNVFHLLPEVLGRVEDNTDLLWHLIVIEDCSTDDRVRPFLRDWTGARADRVTLLENPRNLGFIGSVNKGLKQALKQDNPVILLNSDALVPWGWASRLIAPILRDETVASVTPMSNDAELMTVPQISTRCPLVPGEGDALDALARRFDGRAILPEAPTGVGFCMALNPDFLARVPGFDTDFGRGYGEEVDWCQKTRALGGRHLGLANLFVEHRGGESFGSEAKQALLRRNGAILSGRYPEFDREVQEFIRNDPLVAPRLALAVGLLAERAEGPVPIYLAHSLGGGAEHFLQRGISEDLARGQGSIVLRVGGAERFQLEIRLPSGQVAGTTNNLSYVKELLHPIRARRIVYSCGVGDLDPVGLPDILRDLCRAHTGDRIEVLFHDFLPVSPSYCLLDGDGIYRGPVTPDRADPAHVATRPDGTRVSLVEWQGKWGAVLESATRITVFSENSRDHVLAAWPGLERKLRVRPHELLAPVPRLSAPDGGKTVIGVLGNIGYQKGAGLVEDLGRHLRKDPSMSLVLVGNIDPSFSLPRQVTIHGDYRLDQIGDLVARYGITCWLIPSIWPETFSYTTHEALATGLPVHAFDIGAQGAAVARAENGVPIRFAPDADLVQNILTTIEDRQGPAR